jgi:formylglycine-generating enzyme required for sulfatase activity
VTGVSWHEAAAYAAWLGGALPTEAQWEYAARGTGATSGRRYPWGNEAPDNRRAVFGTSSTERVGSRVAGRTPDGLDDMAGNVWEWCRDLFGDYGETPSTDPLGPPGGGAADARLRVLRGGSFGSAEYNLRAADRGRSAPVNRYNNIGFRVVSSRLRL